MKEDFSELVEYLDEKFVKIDEKFQNTATKEDITNLSLNLSPRAEFEEFRNEVKTELSDIKESINILINSIDKLVKAVSDLSQEYAAIVSKVDSSTTSPNVWHWGFRVDKPEGLVAQSQS